MAKVEDEIMGVQREVLMDCITEARPIEREIGFNEFRNRMLELEFTNEEARRAWEVLASR